MKVKENLEKKLWLVETVLYNLEIVKFDRYLDFFQLIFLIECIKKSKKNTFLVMNQSFLYFKPVHYLIFIHCSETLPQ